MKFELPIVYKEITQYEKSPLFWTHADVLPLLRGREHLLLGCTGPNVDLILQIVQGCDDFVHDGTDACGQIVALCRCTDWCAITREEEERFHVVLSHMPAVYESPEKKKRVKALRLYTQLQWMVIGLQEQNKMDKANLPVLIDAVHRFLDTEGSMRGLSMLEFAVVLFDDDMLVDRILQQGVEKFELNRALLRAAEACRRDRVKVLLDHGADPEGRVVCEHQTEELVSGAEKYLPESRDTPLKRACMGTGLPGQRETVMLLIAHGADVTINGNLPLALALEKRDAEMIDKMIVAGASPRNISHHHLYRIMLCPESTRMYLRAADDAL